MEESGVKEGVKTAGTDGPGAARRKEAILIILSLKKRRNGERRVPIFPSGIIRTLQPSRHTNHKMLKRVEGKEGVGFSQGGGNTPSGNSRRPRLNPVFSWMKCILG